MKNPVSPMISALTLVISLLVGVSQSSAAAEHLDPNEVLGSELQHQLRFNRSIVIPYTLLSDDHRWFVEISPPDSDNALLKIVYVNGIPVNAAKFTEPLLDYGKYRSLANQGASKSICQLIVRVIGFRPEKGFVAEIPQTANTTPSSALVPRAIDRISRKLEAEGTTTYQSYGIYLAHKQYTPLLECTRFAPSNAGLRVRDVIETLGASIVRVRLHERRY